jgi:hypothetical protein
LAAVPSVTGTLPEKVSVSLMPPATLPGRGGHRPQPHQYTRSPQINGVCERFPRAVLDEFYRAAFRRNVYDTIDALQRDLDEWLADYNQARTHQGRYCFGKTPMQTFLDARQLAHDKQIGGLVTHSQVA